MPLYNNSVINGLSIVLKISVWLNDYFIIHFFLKGAMDFHLFKKYFMNSPTMRQSGKYVCAALLPA